jgi:hypothetical protein
MSFFITEYEPYHIKEIVNNLTNFSIQDMMGLFIDIKYSNLKSELKLLLNLKILEKLGAKGSPALDSPGEARQLLKKLESRVIEDISSKIQE